MLSTVNGIPLCPSLPAWTFYKALEKQIERYEEMNGEIALPDEVRMDLRLFALPAILLSRLNVCHEEQNDEMAIGTGLTGR